MRTDTEMLDFLQDTRRIEWRQGSAPLVNGAVYPGSNLREAVTSAMHMADLTGLEAPPVRQAPEPAAEPAALKPLDLYERMGFHLLLDESSVVDRFVIDTNTWEEEQLAYFASLVERFRGKPNLLFLDIGSYWGLYSLLTLRAGVFEKMYAFDADRHNFAQLQTNLFLNNATHAITAFNKAVSDQPGKLLFWDSRTHPNKNRAGVGVVKEDAGLPSYEVDAITIDSMVPTTGGSILMKIDVEGHEESVLRGMEKTIANNKVVMQIEVFEHQHERVFAEVERLGLRQIHSIFPDYYLTNMSAEELGI